MVGPVNQLTTQTIFPGRQGVQHQFESIVDSKFCRSFGPYPAIAGRQTVPARQFRRGGLVIFELPDHDTAQFQLTAFRRQSIGLRIDQIAIPDRAILHQGKVIEISRSGTPLPDQQRDPIFGLRIVDSRKFIRQ